MTGHFYRTRYWVVCLLLTLAGLAGARGEAMLELFQLTWPQITQKMPEIAEAGYDSLWLPNPCKGNSGAYSIGYDVFDPFDLGGTNQQGTVATKYGTQAQLIQMVQTAHRFGIRVYFDNVMNHRASTVPGYPGSGVATNYYPGLIPQDFHLQVVSGGYENWYSVSDWCSIQNVENNPLIGLCDLAQEPGSNNWNYGSGYGNTIIKPVFVRFPGRPDLYMDTNGPVLGAGSGTGWPSPPNGYGPLNGWRPFDGQGQPVPEDVSTYLCRAVAWTLYMTGCDGFRLDAVKHVPVNFFGNATGQTDDPSFGGYCGAIQAMYDYVHGYGGNVTGNGYVETDGNRNSLFNTEATRNDAMIFGEYEASALPQSEDYWEYLNSGMRLLNFPMFNEFNNLINNADNGPGLWGLDGRDYAPSTSEQGNCDSNGNYSVAQAVNMMWDQDGNAYGLTAYDLALEDAYFFMHEGLPMVYSDGFNHNTGGGTPQVSTENYLGEFGDNTMPDTMFTHNQLARGGTWSRWSDQYIVAFERYDYREGNGSQPQTQDVALFGMNDKTSYPGDITFDDGVTRTSDGYYLNPANTTSTAVSNSRGVGLAVGFAPGSVLVQLASSSPTGGRAYQKLLVHGGTTNYEAAVASANDSDPTQRLIYVNTPPPSGGGAIELTIPSGSWVIYAYQWPQASYANPATNAIIFRQNGNPVPTMQVYRTDGPNGDTNYNPTFPFKMRGSVDAYGNRVMYPGEGNVSNLTYAIDIPVVTNANFDILVRSDASCSNTAVKLDGGIDLNSQMGIGPTNATGLAPTNFLDLRDNPPGYADDVFLGYEQTAFQFRNGPEKFAARNIASNNIVSLGAETYYYTVGGSSNVVAGAGYGAGITNQTANWVWHDPTNTVTSLSPNPPSQMNPLNPTSTQSVDIWVKVGYQFQINTCFIYYTTDSSNPEGAFGVGKGTTQVVQGGWVNHDSVQNNIDWWKGTIPAQPNGTQVRYKIALFYGGSVYSGQSISPISDAEPQGSKYYGLTQAAITNFNPTTAIVWLHNDLNPANTVTGLQSGFHIMRARVFLPRSGQSSVYNTFLQTFYYAGALPTGVIAYPTTDGSDITTSSYTVVVRADSSVTEVDYCITDANGQTCGVAGAVSPDSTLSQQYTNYPQEYRFNYNPVASSGTATIAVQLKDVSTSAYANHFTTLTRTVQAEAPSMVVEISSPAQDGAVLVLSSNETYSVQACFTSNLTNAPSNWSVYINNVLQPSASYIFRPVGAVAGCPGMRSLTYIWTNAISQTNVIQVVYTNGITLSATRTVAVARIGDPTDFAGDGVPNWMKILAGTSLYVPNSFLHITGLVVGNPVEVIWSSVPNMTYQVLATTNFDDPMAPIAGAVVTGDPSNTVTRWFDATGDGTNRFYRIQVLVP